MPTELAEPLTDRLPPQNLEAERAVLGAMLLDGGAVALAMEALRPAHFYRDAHRRIFTAVGKLFEADQAVDLVTVIEALRQATALEQVGGASYVSGLAAEVPTAANVEYYCQIVREKAILRTLISAGTEIVTRCYASPEDVGRLLDHAEQAVFDITSRRLSSSAVSMKEAVKAAIELVDRLYQRKQGVTGLATGFDQLDQMTSGLQASDLIVVAGRPSMGKSALVTCIAEHVGERLKLPLVMFSIEMSKEQLVQRMLCSRARVDAFKVRTGFLAPEDWPRLTEAASRLSATEIYIDDAPGMTVLELRAKARRLKARHGIGLIILDYLQLMQGPVGAESRQQEISEISRALKSLARELQVPVVAVSQLSRAVEARADHRPQLSDLRESGAIEQDADVVMLLLREEYYRPTDENRGLAELIIAKQRNGPVGSVFLTFLKEHTRFESLARPSETV